MALLQDNDTERVYLAFSKTKTQSECTWLYWSIMALLQDNETGRVYTALLQDKDTERVYTALMQDKDTERVYTALLQDKDAELVYTALRIHDVNSTRLTSVTVFNFTPSRTLLSASDTLSLQIPRTRRSTVGFRAFSVFGPANVLYDLSLIHI